MIDELIRTGVARFEYSHIINHGPPSMLAALSTECGGDQGAWWDFHDHYMSQWDFSREGAIAFAASLSLDTEEFRQCLDSEKYLELVEGQHRQAVANGFNRTPTVRINDQGGAIVADALIGQVLALAAELEEEG